MKMIAYNITLYSPNGLMILDQTTDSVPDDGIHFSRMRALKHRTTQWVKAYDKRVRDGQFYPREGAESIQPLNMRSQWKVVKGWRPGQPRDQFYRDFGTCKVFVHKQKRGE